MVDGARFDLGAHTLPYRSEPLEHYEPLLRSFFAGSGAA